jgi:nicotinamide-nucleotide amidase
MYGIGIPVEKATVVGDDENAILKAFADAWENFDIVIVTGGLGPTHDDITKKAVCKFFNTDLVMNEEVLAWVKSIFERRGIPMAKINEEQALVPRTCTVLHNRNGTAPGMMFEQNGKYLFVMAGVPFEMKGITEDHVLPFLASKVSKVIRQKTLQTTGIGESALFTLLGDVHDIIGSEKLAFLPSPRGVRMRITVTAESAAEAEKKIADIERRIRAKAEKYIYGVEGEEIEDVLCRLMTERGLTLAVAESCTGGMITDRITNVSGSSNYFERGVIAYSNQSKIDILGVLKELIEKHGAVSREVAEAMASGVRRIADADIGISTTGIAGPTGGTPEKPVGLVWIGYSDKESAFALKFNFGDNRLRTKERASQAAMDLVRRKILNME